MTQNNSQVPWTDEQWVRVNQVIQEEASRARVAATFLPLYGPLPPDTDFVRAEVISEDVSPISIEDRTAIKLVTLQVKLSLRGAQMADPEMTSALALFRRAANVLARLEDALVFNGQAGQNRGPPQGAPPAIWDVGGGQHSPGLLRDVPEARVAVSRNNLVTKVSNAIGVLEGRGHFGPFAVVLDQQFFTAVQTPNASLVLPQDRIIPFLDGGSLLRSSTLPEHSGVVVALGGAPVELVVATDVSLTFLQVTLDPLFVFRVFEKMVLRVKNANAIFALFQER